MPNFLAFGRLMKHLSAHEVIGVAIVKHLIGMNPYPLRFGRKWPTQPYSF